MEPSMRSVNTPLLRTGYEEWNASAQRTVVLLHGWPDSPRAWSGVAPQLAQAGWRVLVPALRGVSPTRSSCVRTRRAPASSPPIRSSIPPPKRLRTRTGRR